MNRNAAAVLIIALVVCCYVPTATNSQTTVYAPFFDSLHPTQLALSVPLVIGVTTQTHPLDQHSRADIYQYIEENPGVHFRGVSEALSLSVGMVQYHVGILCLAGLITVYGDGKMRRFYVKGRFSKEEMKIIALLRRHTAGRILRLLNERRTVGHGELADALGVSSQALTWQMHRLEREGVVVKAQGGLRLYYSVKSCFLDALAKSACFVPV